MTGIPLLGAQKPSKLVGREEQLNTLKAAISRGDDKTVVVFIRGQGGLGKTRLLEEVLLRFDYSLLDWGSVPDKGKWRAEHPHVIPTEIIDFADIRLLVRTHFIRTLRDKLRWMGESEALFHEYDAADAEFRRRVLDNVEYRQQREAAERALQAFWDDYARITEKMRVVWLLDTVERLAIGSTEWLLEEGLLSEDDVAFQTTTWLINSLKEGKLKNTTLILAGRDVEGKKFFQRFRKACEELNIEIKEIGVSPFGGDETRQYFQHLAEQFAQAGKEKASQVFQAITQNEDILLRIHTYTEGRPVLLALVADIIQLGRALPEPLQPGTPIPEHETERMRLRWMLEEEILNLFFLPPTGEEAEKAALRQDILRYLVQTQEGLSAAQLHYLLDNPLRLKPEAWLQTPEGKDLWRQAEIQKEMELLLHLAIVKRLPALEIELNGQNGAGHERQPTYRLGLQDEVYRLFANHLALEPEVLNAEPVDEADAQERKRLRNIWNALSEQEQERYRRKHREEIAARRQTYAALREWAEYWLRIYQERVYDFLVQEEKALEIELEKAMAAYPRAAQLRLTVDQERLRTNYREAIRNLEMERLYYAMLPDPEWGLNDVYVDLSERHGLANDEESNIAVQELVWRLLYDRFLMRFVEWTKRDVVIKRGEHSLDVLRRALQQQAISRWIKRFALRREYQRAKEFAEEVESWIEKTICQPGEEIKCHSWTHPFAKGERTIWKLFAQTFPASGEELLNILQQLNGEIVKLRRLAQHEEEETVFGLTSKISDMPVMGFKGHPAEIRLRRVISMGASTLGYGYTQLGEYEEAIEYYTLALAYLRETGMVAHRALVLNNLSRVLAEQGWGEAAAMCEDALDLRRRLGADQPIGLSHSTLALIYNRLGQPDRAWREAVKARLYFQRVGDARGIAMASQHLAEALRFLANDVQKGFPLPVEPERLLTAAEDSIEEALSTFVFTEQEKKREDQIVEPSRRLEALVEKGCIYRDRIGLPSVSLRSAYQFYGTARSLFEEVVEEAQKGKWERIEIDALVNRAWTHYRLWRKGKETGKKNDKNIDLSQHAIEATDNAIKRISQVLELEVYDLYSPPISIEAYIWYQLSKLYGLLGRIYMDQFISWANELGKRDSDRVSAESLRKIKAERMKKLEEELSSSPHALDTSVQFWCNSLYFTHKFPSSAVLKTILFNSLYDYIKRFNQVEIKAFYKYLGRCEKDKLLKDSAKEIRSFAERTIGIVEE